MKNKKTFIGIVLLIVVLLLGIGYATITKEVSITGDAAANASNDNFTVVFTGVKEVSDENNVEATATNGETTATISVKGLTTTGDKESATYTVKNTSSELQAALNVKTQSVTNTEYFKVTAKIAEPTTIAANGETTVTVTVELIKTPIAEVTSDVTVELTATAVVAQAQ